MKVETKVLSDGRLSIALMENDGSPVATREIDVKQSLNLFAQWALIFIPTTGGDRIALEGREGDKDILIALTDHKEKESTTNNNKQ